MYIEFEGIAGTGGCRGVLGDAVGLVSVESRTGIEVDASTAVGCLGISDLELGKGKGKGEAETDVIEAECAW